MYIDRLALAAATLAYNGGPYLAVFSGSTPFQKADSWTVNTTNSRGGASYNGTFQTAFDRLFNMRSLGLLLPSAASPTISDGLIP